MSTLGVHNTSWTASDRLADGQVPISRLFTASDRARFWAKVDRRGPDECWPWTASLYTPRGTAAGYGQFTVMTPGGAKRKQLHLLAHRVAWILTHGDISDGFHVLHTCDNPGCCNDAHHFLGDHLANMQDAARKGRLSVPRKRTRGFKQTVIARYLAGGVTQYQLAAEYCVSRMTVNRWLRGLHDAYDRPTRREAVA